MMINLKNPNISFIGVWKPINSKYIDQDFQGSIVAPYIKDFILPDGNTGILYGSWAFDWKENQKSVKAINPVNILLISVDSKNIASNVTYDFLPDNITNGVGSIQIADFNKDGKNDIFLSPHNEAPFVSSQTTVYLSNGNVYSKLILNDLVMSHDTALVYFHENPSVISATFQDDRPIKNQLIYTYNLTTKNFDISSPASSVNFGYMSVLGEDFDNDGTIEFIFGGTNWLGSKNGFSRTMKIVSYDWINNDYSAEPIQVITPFLETAKDFQGINSLWGTNNTHTPRLWAEDFNHDGLVDVIALNSLFNSEDNFPIALQMLQNQGKFFFDDKTDQLTKKIPNYTSELDYELSFKTIDNSGINYIFSGIGGNSSNLRQANYIIGNDGTGKLYVILHDEFQTLNSYLYESAIQQINGKEYSQFIQKDKFADFHAIINNKSNINFIASIPSFEGVQQFDGSFKTQLNYTIFNIDTDFNPSTYFKENVTITDRNQSLKLRTWAGNDVFYDLNINKSSSESVTVIDGGQGIDKSAYSDDYGKYKISKSIDSSISVITNSKSNNPINDYLLNIERLQFKDKSIAFDVNENENAGITAKILGAVFGKDSISNKSYVGIGLHFLDTGWTYDNLAALAIDAAGAKSNDQIVNLLWTNVIGTKPTSADKAPYIALLENGMAAGALAHLAADSSFNTTNINLVGLVQTGIEYIPIS